MFDENKWIAKWYEYGGGFCNKGGKVSLMVSSKDFTTEENLRKLAVMMDSLND